MSAKKSKLTIRRVQIRILNLYLNLHLNRRFALEIKYLKMAKINTYETYRFLCDFHLFRDIFSPSQSLLNEGSLAYPFLDPS